MRKIKLANGRGVALVDDEDYECLRKLPWHYQNRGYAKSGRILMHRFILGLTQPGHGVVVDHIDGNRLNNQRSNLQLASQGQNLANTKRKSKSGFRGVRKCALCKSRPWVAQISIDGRTVALGGFETKEAAARAYDKAAKGRFGEFARLNFPAS